MGFIDYKNKTAGLSEYSITLTDDMKADMDKIRAFYEGMQGRFPEKQNPVRLKAESKD